ncbi:MAG: hypothetical protein ACTSUQ_12810 [Candidatus Freyarchaeota archaeon]
MKKKSPYEGKEKNLTDNINEEDVRKSKELIVKAILRGLKTSQLATPHTFLFPNILKRDNTLLPEVNSKQSIKVKKRLIVGMYS